MTMSGLASPTTRSAGGGRGRRLDLELGMQRELLGERAAQLGVVVDDQDLPRLSHADTVAAAPTPG